MNNLSILPGDIVSETLGRGQHWDPHVYDALLPYLDKDVVDVGANVGALTLRFAQVASRVIAFEPNAEMVWHLRANIERMGLQNVVVIPEGLYSYETTIYPAKTGYPPSSWTWPVGLPADQAHVRAGPAWWPEMSHKVSAIKADVQGADLHALMALEGIITRDHPAIVFEFERELAMTHGHAWGDYVNWLVDHGYIHERIDINHDDYLCI